MRVMAVSTGGMAIVVQKNPLGRIVCVIPRWIGMIGCLREFRVNVEQAWSDIAVAVVAGYAVLGVSV